MSFSLGTILSIIPEPVVASAIDGVVDSEMAKLQAELVKLVGEALVKIAGVSPILAQADSTAVSSFVDGVVGTEVAKLGTEIKVLVTDALNKAYGVSIPAPVAATA